MREEQNGFLLAAARMEIRLDDLVTHLNARLRLAEIGDYPNALNGLQLANGGTVRRVGAAVDASLGTVRKAVEAGCDLLLVHHGLFWSGVQPLTGNRFALFELAMRHNLAVYSAHLPLDAGEQGNSRLLAEALALESAPGVSAEWEPSFVAKGTPVGCRTRLQEAIRRDQLVERLKNALAGGSVLVCPGGPEQTREIGVVTGGAGTEVSAVAAQGVETFITGEGAHWTFALAEELGVNLLYGGHYATETFGVKALAGHLQTEFGLPWQFIDHPSGL